MSYSAQVSSQRLVIVAVVAASWIWPAMSWCAAVGPGAVLSRRRGGDAASQDLAVGEQAARVSLRQAGRRSAGSTSMVLFVARPGLLGAVGQDTPERVVRAAEPDPAVGGKEWPRLHRVAVDIFRNTASPPRTTAAQIRGPVLVPASRHLEAFTAARVRQGVWGPLR